MKTRTENFIFKKYPDIFGNHKLPMTQTCMCWGLEIGQGWAKIIKNLCKELTLIKEKTGLRVVADQVKEKFASIRFYYHTEYDEKQRKIDAILDKKILSEKELEEWEDKIRKLVDDAEEESLNTCEECGSKENVTTNQVGWMSTLCNDCREKQKR